jgi:hypothetical protein
MTYRVKLLKGFLATGQRQVPVERLAEIQGQLVTHHVD